MLAPGENNVFGDAFLASIFLPYMKAEMMCSTTRFVFKTPNNLLGFIPLGYDENTIPMRAIASVKTSSKFLLGRAVMALALLIIGFALMGENILIGILLLLLGGAFVVTAFPSSLTVVNHAGGSTELIVSSFEKAKLSRFSKELQNRVFADQSQVHHNEAQDMRSQQLLMQQAQFAMMQNQYAQSQPSAPQQQLPQSHPSAPQQQWPQSQPSAPQQQQWPQQGAPQSQPSAPQQQWPQSQPSAPQQQWAPESQQSAPQPPQPAQ